MLTIFLLEVRSHYSAEEKNIIFSVVLLIMLLELITSTFMMQFRILTFFLLLCAVIPLFLSSFLGFLFLGDLSLSCTQIFEGLPLGVNKQEADYFTAVFQNAEDEENVLS